MLEADDLIPPHPQTQALTSKTFSPPPLDGSLTLPEIFDWHLEHSKEHRLFVFPKGNGEVRNILWPEAVRAIHTGARIVRQIMGWRSGIEVVPVVSILAASGASQAFLISQQLFSNQLIVDTVSYLTISMAILRAGYIAFPISPRNSPAAVAHLLHQVGVSHVFVGHEQSMIDLANESLQLLSSQYPQASQPKFSPVPLFEDLYLESENDPDDIPFEKRGLNDIVIYMHSSGMFEISSCRHLTVASSFDLS